jgi:hypothetical protein
MQFLGILILVMTQFINSSIGKVTRLSSKIALLLGAASLAGCMSSVTTTMQATNDVAAYSVASYEKIELSDEVLADALTIQRVVTKSGPQFVAAVESLKTTETEAPVGLAWANDVTGSQGEITYVSERTTGNTVCRDFKTSLLSFEGVSLYEGLSCKSSAGGWTLKKFSEIS